MADGDASRAVEQALAHIARHEERVNAFITTTEEEARREAQAVDDRGWQGLLHGLPIAVKDNIETAGVRTTSGARFFSDHVPNRDAPVVARLRRAGAVMVGSKHNLLRPEALESIFLMWRFTKVSTEAGRGSGS